MKLVLWDWNGTLLDDVDACLAAINILLGRRSMPSIDKDVYRRIFTFPVIDYYKKLGFNFDKEDFDVVAREYMALYWSSSQQAQLFPKASAVLDYLSSKGYTQSILSAMQQSDLFNQVTANKVVSYFQDIIGLQDIYAKSKLRNALNHITNLKINRDDVCIIGDTYHDYEVAKSIGCKCILISNGHQELDRYTMPDAMILQDIEEVCGLIL
jgi:phosphoglycolate phosphatase